MRSEIEREALEAMMTWGRALALERDADEKYQRALDVAVAATGAAGIKAVAGGPLRAMADKAHEFATAAEAHAKDVAERIAAATPAGFPAP